MPDPLAQPFEYAWGVTASEVIQPSSQKRIQLLKNLFDVQPLCRWGDAPDLVHESGDTLLRRTGLAFYSDSKTEKFSLEIDKDLLTLRVFGTGHEHAVIEKAYIIDLLEVDANREKWMFQAEDKNCISYTLTLDVPRKRLSFINFVNEPTGDKHITMFYYPISDIQINKAAIDAHLKEKGNNK